MNPNTTPKHVRYCPVENHNPAREPDETFEEYKARRRINRMQLDGFKHETKNEQGETVVVKVPGYKDGYYEVETTITSPKRLIALRKYGNK